jgi:hypothetical protein
MLLVVLFSAGSLVALGSDALQAILVQWNRSHTLDIPSAITVSVSTLMVMAMDTGMLVAAATLRELSARRAGFGERAVHIADMVIVAVIEASTYAYMSFRFESPTSAAAEALILARALAAPVLAVYLSMSRALPVTSRDIMSQVELASGRGLLRDVTLAANYRTAPLEQKMRLYGASAVMSVSDRARLSQMVEAAQESGGTNTHSRCRRRPLLLRTHMHRSLLTTPNYLHHNGPDTAISPPADPLDASGDDPERPPTGPGSPAAQPIRTPDRADSSSRRLAVIRLTPTTGRKAAARAHTKASVEARVRRIWRPGMSITEIERLARVSRSSAHKWRRVLEREQAQEVAQ